MCRAATLSGWPGQLQAAILSNESRNSQEESSMRAIPTRSLLSNAVAVIGTAVLSASCPGQARLTQGIRNITVDETRLRAHVIQPRHVQGVVADRGIEEGRITFRMPAAGFGGTPHLQVDAFGKALHARLKDSVAGYVMQLRKNG